MAPYWTRLANSAYAKRFGPVLNGFSLLSTFGLVCFAWIFFRAATLSDAFYIVTHLFAGWNSFVSQSISMIQEGVGTGLWGLVNGFFASVNKLSDLTRSEIVLSVIALLFLLYIEIRQHRGDFLAQFNLKRPVIRYLGYSLLITAILGLVTSYTGVQQAFIYFQF